MKILFTFLILVFSIPFSFANEIMTPDVAIPADPQNRPAATSVHIAKEVVDYDNAAFEITVSNGSISRTFSYTGSNGTTSMNFLNSANCAANSRKNRIFQKLNSDGKLTGTISGSPD